MTFIDDYLAQVEYNDYDRLIQLCDSLANATGFCLMEKRMLDVGFRYGINDILLRKWQATFDIKADFRAAHGMFSVQLAAGRGRKHVRRRGSLSFGLLPAAP